MNRSAAVLLLTLVLGACVAASADGGKMKKYDDSYDREKPEKECHRPHPWSYKTHDCPTCKSNAGCIKTKCNEHYEGKADVTIDVECLFGEHIGFVAVSYKDDGKRVCVNNQNKPHGHDKYDRYIELKKLSCKHLPKLRFIVQDRHWWNPHGKDLEKYDICYDKCTKGKPCHTCIFKDIKIPDCKYWCKHDKCDEHKPRCPKSKDLHCFKYEAKHDYVKVTLKKHCRDYDHLAVAYQKYDDYHKKTAIHRYSYDHKDFSFKVKCKSDFTWYFEDKEYYNKHAPIHFPHDDKCYDYFKHGKDCNQCGPYYEDHVPDCYHDDHEYKKNEKKDEKKDEPKDPKKDEEKDEKKD